MTTLIDIEEQSSDQMFSLVGYIKAKVREEEDTEDNEIVPLLHGLIKYLVEDRIGELYQEEDGVLEEFDF